MQSEQIQKRSAELEERSGRWTTDNIALADGLYTIGSPRSNEPRMPYTGSEGVDPRVRSFVQTVADLAGQPLAGLRVLDLGPAEGLMPLEFARHGAQVTALQPNAACREKIVFLKEVFACDTLEILTDDVRQVHPERHGVFDVVLCAGVLDRLTVADLHLVMRQIVAVCRRLALFDTHVSLADLEGHVHHGLVYWGRTVATFANASSSEASGSDGPFWLTRASLLNLLRHVGFTSVLECHNPMGFVFADRHTLAAIKGERQTIHTVPLLNQPEEDRAEKEPLSAPPRENADVWRGHQGLVANYNYVMKEYLALYLRHRPFTHLSGILRQLPRSIWQAIRQQWLRLRGKKSPKS